MSDTVIRGQGEKSISANPQVGFSNVDNADVFFRGMPQEYRQSKLPSVASANRGVLANNDFVPQLRDLLRVEPHDRSVIVPHVYYQQLEETATWVRDLANNGDQNAQVLANLLSESTALIHESLLGRYAAIRC